MLRIAYIKKDKDQERIEAIKYRQAQDMKRAERKIKKQNSLTPQYKTQNK